MEALAICIKVSHVRSIIPRAATIAKYGAPASTTVLPAIGTIVEPTHLVIFEFMINRCLTTVRLTRFRMPCSGTGQRKYLSLEVVLFPHLISQAFSIFILGIGNLGALDFQARCMASKTPTTARLGCIIGGLFTFFIGIPFAYAGAITRVYYGPDSVHGEFEADSCAVQLGLPTCALWLPDASGFIKLLTHEAPECKSEVSFSCTFQECLVLIAFF